MLLQFTPTPLEGEAFGGTYTFVENSFGSPTTLLKTASCYLLPF
jgi:hypothetical protein